LRARIILARGAALLQPHCNHAGARAGEAAGSRKLELKQPRLVTPIGRASAAALPRLGSRVRSQDSTERRGRRVRNVLDLFVTLRYGARHDRRLDASWIHYDGRNQVHHADGWALWVPLSVFPAPNSAQTATCPVSLTRHTLGA